MDMASGPITRPIDQGQSPWTRKGSWAPLRRTHWWNNFWRVRYVQVKQKKPNKQTIKNHPLKWLYRSHVQSVYGAFIAATLPRVGGRERRCIVWTKCLLNLFEGKKKKNQTTSRCSRCALFNRRGRNDLFALPQVVYWAVVQLKYKFALRHCNTVSWWTDSLCNRSHAAPVTVSHVDEQFMEKLIRTHKPSWHIY